MAALYLFVSVLHSSLLREAIVLTKTWKSKQKLEQIFITFLGVLLLINKVFWIDVHSSYILYEVSQSEITGVAPLVSWSLRPNVGVPASLGPRETAAGLPPSEVLTGLSSC